MMANSIVDSYGRTMDERKALKAKIDQVNAEARENWDKESWRHERAAEITETIYLGFEHENLLSLMAEVENVPFDGRSFVKEVRGLRAFWVSRGGHIEQSTMKEEVFEIYRDTIGFHVSEFEDKLRTSFGETQASLVELGMQRLDAEVNRRVLGVFQAAVPTSSAYYIATNGVNLASVNQALREVRDESRTFEVSIVGRGTMIDQFMDKILGGTSIGAGFLPETNEQLIQRGVLGTYRGARLITLKNFKDDADVSFFPANEMYIVSRDASKFAFFGDMLSKDWVENDAWYWHYQTRRDFGGVCHRPERLRRYVDIGLSA
jgi:hypothetical protein